MTEAKKKFYVIQEGGGGHHAHYVIYAGTDETKARTYYADALDRIATQAAHWEPQSVPLARVELAEQIIVVDKQPLPFDHE